MVATQNMCQNNPGLPSADSWAPSRGGCCAGPSGAWSWPTTGSLDISRNRLVGHLSPFLFDNTNLVPTIYPSLNELDFEKTGIRFHTTLCSWTSATHRVNGSVAPPPYLWSSLASPLPSLHRPATGYSIEDPCAWHTPGVWRSAHA